MGSGVSLGGLDSGFYIGERIFGSMNESRLLHIVFSTETDDRCNMVHIIVSYCGEYEDIW